MILNPVILYHFPCHYTFLGLTYILSNGVLNIYFRFNFIKQNLTALAFAVLKIVTILFPIFRFQ